MLESNDNVGTSIMTLFNDLMLLYWILKNGWGGGCLGPVNKVLATQT